MQKHGDTPPEVEKVLLQGIRRMSPKQKLHRVSQLNRALRELAAAGMRARYGPDISERELNLRLAALRLGRPTMIAAFQWDPNEHR